MVTFYLPTRSAEQWAQRLAEPTKHWRQGFSARTLAYCWQEADGFPSEVRTVLHAANPSARSSCCSAFQNTKCRCRAARAPPRVTSGASPSPARAVSIAIEGKVAEPFGPTVGDWLAAGSPGKRARLGFLQDQLSLSAEPPHGIRYQLLHRSVSAIVEAKRFAARQAIMLVHSFSPTNAWFADFAAFARTLGVEAEPNRLFPAGIRAGVEFYLGWVSGNQAYLTR